MLFQMQIPEIFSYDTKYWMKCFLFLPKKYKMEKRDKTEHNIATQAVYEHLIFICFFSSLHWPVLLLSILKYI